MKLYRRILNSLIDAHEKANPKVDRDRFERRFLKFHIDRVFGVTENQLEVRYAMVNHDVDYSFQHGQPLSLQEEVDGFMISVRKVISDFKKTQTEGSAEWNKIMKEWCDAKA